MTTTERVYLATSWKNPYYEDYLEYIASYAFQVYDFRDPNFKFTWEEVDKGWKEWDAETYAIAIKSHPECLRGANRDFEAMEWCDTIVALEPFGKSASFELGWCQGKGKKTILAYPHGVNVGNPELMFSRVDHIVWNKPMLYTALEF